MLIVYYVCDFLIVACFRYRHC